ncbi:UDP-N-acetylmuramate dehydrogenase [Treponema primitia]|uniref:UDP-N-acetylmuramate dehydrogenase n=1 Tax=Treponema primitia TaxID=88058 RepID=UPI0002554D2F|nr:UDP-N-acetylmuramate dehydrogenase [Treponema primitia]
MPLPPPVFADILRYMYTSTNLLDIAKAIAAETAFSGEMRCNEPMASHTTFKVGGPAELWVRPQGDCFPGFVAAILGQARALGIPLFVLGGGANLVAADAGIRGIVLDTTGWSGGAGWEGGSVKVRAGTVVDEAVEAAAERGWGGLEFLAGMPGTVGGAVWMNARCYEKQVSDVLMGTEILDENFQRVWVPCKAGDFAYKRSPFQKRDVVILAAEFRLEKRAAADIRQEMEAHRQDRKEKGHYRYPSAGSVFKNNREFGKPTGKIIDELGLRGLRIGGAQLAPWHGNIIINTGNATAADIRKLTEQAARRVKDALGIALEPEIIFVGNWEENG